MQLPEGRGAYPVPVIAHNALAFAVWNNGVKDWDTGQWVMQPSIDHYLHGDAARDASARATQGDVQIVNSQPASPMVAAAPALIDDTPWWAAPREEGGGA
jgi:hypothetical protein